MALVKCPKCTSEIADDADTCPNCGTKLKKEGCGCFSLLGTLLIAAVVLALIASIPGVITFILMLTAK